MKRILITGANSYIGTSFEKWMSQWPDQYQISTIDMVDGTWRQHDFSQYDVVYHVAGIAHVSSKKHMAPLYFKVNRDLAIETAQKAKDSGVRQFIFMSSMIIFGKDNRIGNIRPIDITKYAPTNAYGQSKLDADLTIQELSQDSFVTSVIRTPVVYGPKCKGNFPRLVDFVNHFGLFPKIHNKKSMIFIYNLTEYVRLVIDKRIGGDLYPQNKETVDITSLLKSIAKIKDRKIRFTSAFNWIFTFLSFIFKDINRIYGNKYYMNEDSHIDMKEYNLFSFNQSVLISVLPENDPIKHE